MCENIKKLLEESKVTCVVTMDGKDHESDDFVAILSKENGDASIFYNTDALTLGMAMKMVSRAFVEAMHELPEEERTMVQEILGGAFVADKPQEEEANA